MPSTPAKASPISSRDWTTELPVKVILTDIEGTISLVSFVFDVLTPELVAHLPVYTACHTV